jgi:hypothetical protein
LTKDYTPRKNHYEGRICHQLIAAALFSTTSSVGRMFPEYFSPFRITTLAFVFATAQFCIEEWSSGEFRNTSLGSTNMVAKYESHLTGLVAFRNVAALRLKNLSNDWRNFGL